MKKIFSILFVLFISNFIIAQDPCDGDTTPPIIEAEDFTIFTNSWNCVGEFYFPDPLVIEDENGISNYEVTSVNDVSLLAPHTDFNLTDFYQALNIPVGDNTFEYTATDNCGNTSSTSFTVHVMERTVELTMQSLETEVDEIYPLPQISVTSLNLDFGCRVTEVQIARVSDPCDIQGNTTFSAIGYPDDGSSDPDASDYDPDGGAYITFCDADITEVDENGLEYGIVPIKVRVITDDNHSGVFGDTIDKNGDGDTQDLGEYDNYVQNNGQVTVYRGSSVFVDCADEIEITCEQDFTNLELTGYPTVTDPNGNNEFTVSYNKQLNACGAGVVFAEFTSVADPSRSCEQMINVIRTNDAITLEEITFPSDIPAEGEEPVLCLNSVTFDLPVIDAHPCDFIGFMENFDTVYVSDVNSEIIITRNITVIDWCTYDDTNGQEGLFNHTATVTFLDEKPVAECVLEAQSALPGEEITIKAIDFDISSNDVCTDDDLLKFTFTSTPPSSDQNFIPFFRSSEITINESVTEVDVYVWDDLNNYDKCTVVLSDLVSVDDPIGNIISLSQNQPNPFSSSTVIPFELKNSGEVKITLLDANGKELFNTQQVYPAGANKYVLDAADCPTGLLLCKIQNGNSMSILRMVKM